METDSMEKVMEKASVLIEALPYIQRFNRKIIVVKYGGSAMVDENLKKQVIQDCTLLKLVGFKPVIVHGGGKEISRWVEKAGMTPEFINGLRVTDEATMEIAEMVLNRVNKSLVQMVESLGVHAIEKDFLPIICPIGVDDDFNTYNINADDAACAIAQAIAAEKLAFLTDIEGVCKDPSDKTTLISEMSISEAKKLIEDGFIGGGMLPKLKNCIDAVESGVNRVHILDGRVAHCLLLEFFTNRGIGTALIRDEDERYSEN